VTPPFREPKSNELVALRDEVAKLQAEILRLETLRSEAETERDEQLDLYQAAPLPALTLDPAYAIRRLNHAAAQLLGDEPAALLGKSFRAFVAQADRSKLAPCLARAAAAGGVEGFRMALELTRLPSIPVQVWVRASRLQGTFEVRLLDLREQEKAEEEARRMIEAERDARLASAAKDKFIAILSHELRAPLTPVLALASSFRMKDLPPAIKEAFEMVERNVSAEARLIDDLLDVNRIVRNKMQVECRTSDVHKIMQEALATLDSELVAKRHQVECELTARSRHASVDPLRLRQVFMNLLKNAIKFTAPGGRLRIRSWNGQDYLAIEVEDDGPGMEPELMAHLFEPFMDERSGTVSGGLGLGLAISKGLIELQNGKISGHSRGRGQGARFVVELPTVIPTVPSLPPPESHSEPPPPVELNGRHSRVLLIDDHQDTVDILAEILTDHGFLVETASTVKAAQAANLEHVDVIVSDIGLPDGNGFDLMRELRTRTKSPAIALTGYGMESDVKAAKEAGFDLHLTKPIDIERLLGAIQKLASKGRGSGAVGALTSPALVSSRQH
jgi:signal transduction histidine kinase/ActR/RegA family two-component response regulator